MASKFLTCTVTLNDNELELIRLALMDAEQHAKDMAAKSLTSEYHPIGLKALRLRFCYFRGRD